MPEIVWELLADTDPLSADLPGRRVWLPIPGTGDAGKVPAVNGTEDGYELVEQTGGGGGGGSVLVSNDMRNWPDGALSASPLTRGEGSLGACGFFDAYAFSPSSQQEAQVVDGVLRVRNTGAQRVSVTYLSGADLTASQAWWSTQDRVRIGFMFAGWAGGTDPEALGDGTATVRTDALPAKVTLIATDATGEGYIAQFAARHWDSGDGPRVHYEFNFGRDVLGLPVIDEYHELPRAPVAGDVFEMELVRWGDGTHSILLYFNGELIDSATSSAFDLRDFAVFGSPMDNQEIADKSQWRPGVVDTWMTTGDHWRPDRPAAAGSGDVVGPGSSVDGRFALFDGTDGTTLKQSASAPGDAAYKNTGTSAGTVAAGDHTHSEFTYRTRRVYKTADEVVNSGTSTTLQDDDHLTCAVGANEVLMIEAMLSCSGSSSDDMKVTVTAPSGATAELLVLAVLAAGTTNQAIAGYIATPGSDVVTVGMQSGATTRTPVAIQGCVFNGSTPGNVTIQWAPANAGSTDLRVRKGSTLIYTRLA